MHVARENHRLPMPPATRVIAIAFTRHWQALGVGRSRPAIYLRHGLSASALLLGRDFVDDGVGAPEAFRRDRNAGVDAGLQENFCNLLWGHAVV